MTDIICIFRYFCYWNLIYFHSRNRCDVLHNRVNIFSLFLYSLTVLLMSIFSYIWSWFLTKGCQYTKIIFALISSKIPSLQSITYVLYQSSLTHIGFYLFFPTSNDSFFIDNFHHIWKKSLICFQLSIS